MPDIESCVVSFLSTIKFILEVVLASMYNVPIDGYFNGRVILLECICPQLIQCPYWEVPCVNENYSTYKDSYSNFFSKKAPC